MTADSLGLEIAPRIFCFGAFELDEAAFELRKHGGAIPIEPRTFRLLLCLIAQANVWVRDDDLFAAIWPRLHVTDAALQGAVRDARRALGDSAKAQTWIQTKHRVGYRFYGPVELRSGAHAPRDALAARSGSGLHGAPRHPSMRFVGRAGELERLIERLADPDDLYAQVAIAGLVGVGKTELALQVAYRCAREQRFAGGIFWLNAEQPDLSFVWGGALADACAIAEVPVERRCRALIAELEQRRELILVVLDNVSHWSEDARPGPLPRGPHVRLLVTTRVRNLGGSQFEHLDLDVLEPPADRELLCALAGREPEPGLSPLLAAVGGHVLALELAGAFLATYRSESAQTYLAALEDAQLEAEPHPHVTHAFRTLWERLDEPVRKAWRIAACFAPEPVTRELANAAGIEAPLLRALERLHLIKTSAAGHFCMHRLTRAFGQRAGNAEELDSAASAFLLGCIARAQAVDGRSGPDLCLADRAHFASAVERAPHVRGGALELELLVTVGPVLIAHAGYTAPTAQALNARALRAAEQADADEPLFLALEGLWAHCFVEANWGHAGELLTRFERLAQAERDPELLCRSGFALVSGQHALYTGAVRNACNLFGRGLSLLRDRPLTRAVRRNHIGLLSYAGCAHCIAGAPERGLELAAQAVQHALSDGDRSLLAVALVMCAAVHEMRREPAQAEQLCARAVDLARDLELPMQLGFGSVLLSWARFASDPARQSAALDTMLEALPELGRRGIGIAVPHLMGLAAQACKRMGRRREAVALISEALRLTREHGEGFTEPELWRVRAGLCESRAEAVQHLRHALQLAVERKALLWEICSLTDLIEAVEARELRCRYERQLRGALSRYSDSWELSDLRRARSVLERHAEARALPGE